MLLDLREIIESPGGKVTFDFEPDTIDLITGSVSGIKTPLRASGVVENKAGLLTVTSLLEGILTCTCARCLKEFEKPINTTITANITESGVGEDPDGYFLQGNEIDITEIIITEFILSMDDVLICDESCAGLCQRCGIDLNKGDCNCQKETDPRLEVLKQLLD